MFLGMGGGNYKTIYQNITKDKAFYLDEVTHEKSPSDKCKLDGQFSLIWDNVNRRAEKIKNEKIMKKSIKLPVYKTVQRILFGLLIENSLFVTFSADFFYFFCCEEALNLKGIAASGSLNFAKLLYKSFFATFINKI